jgi:class 3 adenylate cyclase
VIGEVTNLAARLQGQAKGHEILLSEEAHRRLKDRLVAGSESLALKGFDRPVTAYRVLAPRARLISGNSRS